MKVVSAPTLLSRNHNSNKLTEKDEAVSKMPKKNIPTMMMTFFNIPRIMFLDSFQRAQIVACKKEEKAISLRSRS